LSSGILEDKDFPRGQQHWSEVENGDENVKIINLPQQHSDCALMFLIVCLCTWRKCVWITDYVYFETSSTAPYQIRRIEELCKVINFAANLLIMRSWSTVIVRGLVPH